MGPLTAHFPSLCQECQAWEDCCWEAQGSSQQKTGCQRWAWRGGRGRGTGYWTPCKEKTQGQIFQMTHLMGLLFDWGKLLTTTKCIAHDQFGPLLLWVRCWLQLRPSPVLSILSFAWGAGKKTQSCLCVCRFAPSLATTTTSLAFLNLGCRNRKPSIFARSRSWIGATTRCPLMMNIWSLQ